MFLNSNKSCISTTCLFSIVFYLSAWEITANNEMCSKSAFHSSFQKVIQLSFTCSTLVGNDTSQREIHFSPSFWCETWSHLLSPEMFKLAIPLHTFRAITRCCAGMNAHASNKIWSPVIKAQYDSTIYRLYLCCKNTCFILWSVAGKGSWKCRQIYVHIQSNLWRFPPINLSKRITMMWPWNGSQITICVLTDATYELH